MPNIPLPSGIDAAQRRFREIQAAIDTTGARTLEAATISGGNLRVRHGGNIIIGDGGTLNISGGNLKLGKGKIQGDALTEQFEAKIIKVPAKTGYPGSSWTPISFSQITVPAWAQRTIVIGSWYAYRDYGPNEELFADKANRAQMVVGTGYTLDISFTWQQRINGNNRLSASGIGIFSIPGASSFAVGVQAVGGGSVTASCEAICLFTRNNS